MAKEDKVKEMNKLIDKYNKLLAKKKLLEEERDNLEKKAFKMLLEQTEKLNKNEE
ncbi:hypothetical protein ACFL3T_02000 [Patescibacteria group bacterium]